jgi:hypothetical protein
MSLGSVPNLAPHAHTPLDGSDKCGGHCIHVELVWRETKAIKRLVWAVILGVAGLFAKEIVPAATSRGRESVPVMHGGERLAPDRIEEPQR